MIQSLFNETESKMAKTVEALKKELGSLRAGRANPSLLEKIMVNYYGTATPVNQMANISAPEARLLVIQPWDKSTVPEVEKAILKSDLGLTPASDGNIIRIPIPQLTEERRKELVKVVKKKAEESKVAVRNLRRDANEEIKFFEKEGETSEDEAHKAQDQVQELTNKYVKKIDDVLANKEAEIMEV